MIKQLMTATMRVAAAVAMTALLAAQDANAQSSGKTLRFIPQADLRILDPIATTAYITRNHGYMVYDTLFAMDEKFQVQPQMVDKCETERRRAHLHLHAARRAQVPRRPAGALGRLHRLDRALGQARRARPEARRSRPTSWTAVDDKTFTLKLKKPFPLTLEALGKPSSNVPFIMPERIAKTDPFENIDDADRLGSVQVREGRVGARQQGGLRQEHRLRAAQGAAVLGRRRQGRQGRPRRVDLHPGFGHRRRCAQRRRGRLVGAAAARPDPAARARTRTSRSRTSTRWARWA